MSARARAASAGSTAKAAASNPFVRRLIEDQELRDNIVAAFMSSKIALGRLQNGKSPAQAVMEDKKLQKELRNAFEALRDVGGAISEPKRKPKKKRRLGRLVLVAVLGAGLALVLSEPLREKVLDLLFGQEEEFEYSTNGTDPASFPSAAVNA
mgnify:CR=1 FL=1